MINAQEINNLPIDELQKAIASVNIIDKIEFSEISKETIKEKINHLRTVQVPNRTVFLNSDDEEIVFYWFKNWLHPKLKTITRKSPQSKVGCSRRVLENDAKRDMIAFYENGQQNYNYTLKDIEDWCNL